jgi:hypothetical protein
MEAPHLPATPPFLPAEHNWSAKCLRLPGAALTAREKRWGV